MINTTLESGGVANEKGKTDYGGGAVRRDAAWVLLYGGD